MTAFIAYAYTPVDESAGRRVKEQGIFTTFEKAREFIAVLVENLDEGEHETAQFLVLEIAMDCLQPWETERHWYFDATAEPLYYSNSKSPRGAPPESDAQFAKGDLVFIRAFPWNLYSPVQRDVIGVVHYAPERGLEEDSSDEYVVSFIDDAGLLDHCHAPGISLHPYSDPLPENLRFLRLLSQFHRGERNVADEFLEAIYYRRMRVVDTPVFPFADDE
jgi:hypothetical protein